MTVKELYDKLEEYIKIGHADTRVIANCNFKITHGNGVYGGFYLIHLNDVYYPSGDIELRFSQDENEEE